MKVFDEYIIPINETAKDYDEMFVGIIRRQPVLIRCKDCKFASSCYGDIVRCSKGGGEVHRPLGMNGYCSLAERKEE